MERNWTFIVIYLGTLLGVFLIVATLSGIWWLGLIAIVVLHYLIMRVN